MSRKAPEPNGRADRSQLADGRIATFRNGVYLFGTALFPDMRERLVFHLADRTHASRSRRSP